MYILVVDATMDEACHSQAVLAPGAEEALARLATSGFSPEVRAKCAQWHQRGAELLAKLDSMLHRKAQTEQLVVSAERRIAEARAILRALRLALDEIKDGDDPIGHAAARVRARLPPLAPAAAEAVCDISDAEIHAVRSLNHAPPAAVRVVITSVCSLLCLTRSPSSTLSKGGHLVAWDDARAMLARADFTKALKGFDPRVLHAHPDVAVCVRHNLSELSHQPSPRMAGRSALAHAYAHHSGRGTAGCVSSVMDVTAMLRRAVRAGGRSLGQLFLWCSRVLAEAADLKEMDELEIAREVESGAISAVLAEAEARLADLEALSTGCRALDRSV